MARRVSTHLTRLRLRPVRRGPSAWPRLAPSQLQTRRARVCSGMARRCGGFSRTAKAVRCPHPVDGCVRPFKMSATRWLVIYKPKKGSCRVAMEPSGWRSCPWAGCCTGCLGARGPICPRPASGRGHSEAERCGDSGGASGAVPLVAGGVAGEHGSPPAAWRQDEAQLGAGVVGGEAADFPTDNVDLERWFKGPKGHERRIHGQSHAGVRMVR